MVVREQRYGGLVACGYLVDTFCLGVKNTIGPKSVEPDRLREFVASYFRAFDRPPFAVPLELAQYLVLGAVEFARGLGFEPHPDFARVREYLGAAPAGPNPITFGQDGMPYFISGPNDDAYAVMNTLRRTVGDGKFDYLMPA